MAAIMWGFYKFEVNRLDRFSWNLDNLHIFMKLLERFLIQQKEPT